MDFTGRRHEAKPRNPRPEAQGGTTGETRQGVRPQALSEMQRKESRGCKAKEGKESGRLQRKESRGMERNGKERKERKGKECNGKECNGWNGWNGMEKSSIASSGGPPLLPHPDPPHAAGLCRYRPGAWGLRFGTSTSARSAPFWVVQSAPMPFITVACPLWAPKGPLKDPSGSLKDP